MLFNCPICGSGKLRCSRFRLGDLGWLLTLQYPVRCRVCRNRWHRNFAVALAIAFMAAFRGIQKPHRAPAKRESQ